MSQRSEPAGTQGPDSSGRHPRAHGPAQAPAAVEQRALDLSGVLWMLGITFLWGLNSVTVKVVTGGVSPAMGAAIRSLIALALLAAYGRWRREPLWYGGRPGLHGAAIGLMFAVEFLLIYSGTRLTTAGHATVFLNTSPFFVAVGAHFLLAGERLTLTRVLGLTTAFLGVVLLFADRHAAWTPTAMWGDGMVLAAAAIWGTQTLYIKRFLVGRLSAFGMLYLQILVSVPFLLGASWLWETDRFPHIDAWVAASLVYQGAVVVFFSYLMWIVLLSRYPAAVLQSFVFLSPVWGVALATALLGEPLSPNLVGSLVLVAGGLLLINRRGPGRGPIRKPARP